MKLSRDLKKARDAFEEGDIEKMKEAHIVGAPERHAQEAGKIVKSVIYGGVDGIITTFAIVAGVVGAKLSLNVVLILGLANLLADGLSMGIGDYLSSKSEKEYEADERKREEWEVEHFPEGEKQEMIELYEQKGISTEDATIIVKTLSKYPEAWIDIMMVEELEILESSESPLKNGIVTFLSFVFLGFVPLVSYVLSQLIPFFNDQPLFSFIIACVLTAVTLFTLGAFKTRITGKSFLISGLEMLVLGGLAAAAAYGIGAGLSVLL